jgi:RNA polymerase sigma factor (sigma-70 family)
MSKRDPHQVRELVQKCLKGEESAWAELVKLISPVAFGVCKSMRLTRDESVEIFGQTCYLLLSSLDNLRSPEKLLSYVATTVRREAMRMISRARFFEDARRQEFIELEPAGHESAEVRLEREEDVEIIHRALLLIPPEDAELLRLLFLDKSQPSYEEISKRMGIPVSSIGPTRMRALEKLRKALKRLDFEF